MEVYTLDPLLRRDQVIDRFESLIWTERYQAYGDFEMVIRSTKESRGLLKEGTRLAMNESYRVMTVETIEDEVDHDGKAMLKVTGTSLESMLIDRVAMGSTDDLTTTPKWALTGAPAAVARQIFHDICVTGILSTNDIIPFVIEGTIMPDDTLEEPVDPISIELDPTTVYDAIRDICDVWNLGFRMLRNFDASELYFDIYAGNDRTTAQTTLDPVIFSPNLDNLQNTKELLTIADTKNVVYVYSPAGFLEYVAPDVDPEVEGLDRRVLVVKADDITSGTTEEITAALTQRAREEIAKHRKFQAFDGEIDRNSQYKYGVDYILGDLVEMQNVDGVVNIMRVTEQIFVSDGEGERAYPTLAVNTFVNTGSWLSWTSNITWLDLDADSTTWSEQP